MEIIVSLVEISFFSSKTFSSILCSRGIILLYSNLWNRNIFILALHHLRTLGFMLSVNLIIIYHNPSQWVSKKICSVSSWFIFSRHAYPLNQLATFPNTITEGWQGYSHYSFKMFTPRDASERTAVIRKFSIMCVLKFVKFQIFCVHILVTR